MKSHTCEFTSGDILQLVGDPLLPVAAFALLMHGAVGLDILPAPRPTLDTERTILIHQAETAQRWSNAEVLLLGDSSCLMDVSARQLGEKLGRPVLSLATFSYLDLEAHALMLRQFVQANPNRLRAVVLLMHPESLRRIGSEPYYVKVLTNFWAAQDHSENQTVLGQVTGALGVDIFKGRLLSRWVPLSLDGAYGRRYGFNRDLEAFLEREKGSAIDPDTPQPFNGSAEYRLAPTLERASQNFRNAVPRGAKLLVGITPVPQSFAGARHPEVNAELLRQWAAWLKADAVLNGLPAVFPGESFVRTTHLKEEAIPGYTQQLAAAIQSHLP